MSALEFNFGEPDPIPAGIENIQPIDPNNPYDHPVVKDLMRQLAELTKSMDSFEARSRQAESRWREARKAKDDFIASINEQLAAFEADVRRADQERREMDAQMRTMLQAKDQLNVTIMDAVEKHQATIAAEAAEARWLDMVAKWEFQWTSAIKGFQLLCIHFVTDAFEAGHFGVGIFDEMGLGKTLEADAVIDVIQQLGSFETIISGRCPNIDWTEPESQCVLWFCPTSIKEATVRELRKWGRANTIKLDGKPEDRKNKVRIARQMGLTLVVGYEQLRDRNGQPTTPELFQHEWPIVVMDEAHRFKNETSSTFQRIRQICENAGFVIPMTGTPILNKHEELWSLLHMMTLKGVLEGKFGRLTDKVQSAKRRFIDEYGAWGNAWTHQALINEVKDIVIRRKKKDVFDDLPDMIREVRFVELTGQQLDLYNEMRDQFLIWLDEQKTDFVSGSNVLAQLTYLRQINLYPAAVKLKKIDPDTGKLVPSDRIIDCQESAKLDEAMDIVEELLGSDRKVLIFCNFNEPLKEFRRRIEARAANGELTYRGQPVKAGLITGEQTPETKANVQDHFTDEDDPMAVCLGNITAMGLGLNLQAACSDEIFLDLYWNPGINEQAEARLHRQGQKNSVSVTIIQGEDTVDGFIAKIIEDKQEMIDGTINVSELRQMLRDGLI